MAGEIEEFETSPIHSDPDRRSKSSTIEDIKYPHEPSNSSKSMNDLTKYLDLHKAILEGILESAVEFCEGDEMHLKSLLMAKRNSNSLALLLPILTGENYDIWSIKMKTYFLSQDLWGTIQEGISSPEKTPYLITEQEERLKQSKQNDAKAFSILQQAVDDYVYKFIFRAPTARDAWDTLKYEYRFAKSKRSINDLKKYLNLHEAILEGMLESVVKFCKGDNIRLGSLLKAQRNSNSLALLIPIFTGEKYHIWSLKMKTYFLSQDLWGTVHDGISFPERTSYLSTEQEEQLKQSRQNDAGALFILQQAVDDDIFRKISHAQTAKEAWDALRKEFDGNFKDSSSKQTKKDLAKYLNKHEAKLEGILKSVVECSKGDKIRLESLLRAKRNINSLALLLPIFTGEKYDIWRITMKEIFLSRDLWDTVHQGISFPENTSPLSREHKEQLQQSKQNDAGALFILQQAVDDNIFEIISRAQTAKEAWDALRKEFDCNFQDLSSKETMNDLTNYLNLHKAILEGNLESVEKFCKHDKHMLEARITVNLDTALHVAVGTGKTNHIVEFLLDEMSMDQVSLQNNEGNTALSVAAIVGNVQAVNKIMMKDEHQILFNVANNFGWIPLILAAQHCQKEVIEYLLPFSDSYLSYAAGTRFEEKSGVLFITLLINAGFYDLTLELLRRHPELAVMELYGGESLLTAMLRKPFAFPTGKGRKQNVWHFMIETLMRTSHIIATPVTKLMHQKALELVRYLCIIITTKLNYERASSILKRPFLLAAELGVSEVVKEIIKSFPDAGWFSNENYHNVLQLAVMNRQEKICNLISQTSGLKHLLLMSQDNDGNNILHLSGKLAPQNQLNLIPGAALQMQFELQWFKVMEKIVQPSYKDDKNSKGETPQMVFTEEHKELFKKGEKWMKQAATRCTLATALIVIIVFVAAVSVPTGNRDDGQSKLFDNTTLKIFRISDSVSLVSSIASIITFLSLHFRRYSEGDFLHLLPRRLIYGLGLMFGSATLMIVAYGTIFYEAVFENKGYLILVLLGASICLPLCLFVCLQVPFMVNLVLYTFGSGSFCIWKQPSDVPTNSLLQKLYCNMQKRVRERKYSYVRDVSGRITTFSPEASSHEPEFCSKHQEASKPPYNVWIEER